MGGQGFLIGRGNLQLSPEVLRIIGIESILGVATPAKLLGLSHVRITGDESLDESSAPGNLSKCSKDIGQLE